MKRIGNLYNKIVDLDNIERAIIQASKGKTKRKNVCDALNNLRASALKIQDMLVNKTYKPSPYIKMTIRDGANKKEREIFKPCFYPDQCIHWALMLQLQDALLKKMYYWNCASIKGRGLNHGKKHIEKILKSDKKNTKYCLKLDVRKFYPSISKDVLKKKFQRIIKDKDTLWLINIIIDSAESGIPIGNYTSQWFANFYLSDLDRYIKEELKIKHYVRYMDDMVLFSSNKKKLHNAKEKIDEFLSKEHLVLKNNWQLFKVSSRPIDFLGYRFYRSHVTLRPSNFLRIKRRVKKASKKEELKYKDAAAILSYYGWLSHCNSFTYREKYIYSFISFKQCKEVVSNETRKRNKAYNRL